MKAYAEKVELPDLRRVPLLIALATGLLVCCALASLAYSQPGEVSTCRSIQVYDASTGAYDPAVLNSIVTVEGIVYVAPGTYAAWGGGYLQDETGGINFWREQAPAGLNIGDRIRITGPIWPDAGMLHVGTYTCVKLDSLLTPLPTEYSLSELMSDFGNTGSQVRVTGLVAELMADSFWLEDGPDRVEVQRSDYAGVDFGVLAEGMTCTVVSPCIKRDGTMFLLPQNQAGIVLPDAHYVAVAGDDADLGTPERPYRTIQRGILAAQDGDVVLIADGLYTGDGNRDIDFMGKIIRVRSLSGQREACVIDAEGSLAEPRVGFKFTGGETRESVLEGVTVTGGYPAGITIDVPNIQTASSPTIRNVVLEQNAGAGLLTLNARISDGSAWAVTPRVVSTAIRDNIGNGLSLKYFSGADIDSCEVRGNGGIGLEVTDFNATTRVHDTLILENSEDGIFSIGNGHEHRLRLLRCQVSGNGGWGIATEGEDADLWADGVIIDNNGLGGLRTNTFTPITVMDNCDVRYNSGPGLYFDGINYWSLADCRIIGNLGDGVYARQPTEGFGRDNVSDCVISENGGTGIRFGGGAMGSYYVFTVSRTLLTRNDNGGIHLDGYNGHQAEGFRLHSVTIADNVGFGVNYASEDLACEVANTVIAGNTGPALIAAQTGLLTVTCSDFHGNDGGDWSGPLAGYLGTGGNLSTDPLFCDAAGGDYHLRRNSPLSADNSGACGTIGALEWNCASLSAWPCEPQLSDVPGDQGGNLRVSWAAHPADAPTAPVPITTYEIQSFGSAWQTIATMAAAAADSYATDVVTPAILTLGQPAPHARYRLLARTADPLVFFESLEDSAFSIDNLPPPKPAAFLVEGLDYRYVTWFDPELPDLGSACVYRGDESGFTPGEPIACPQSYYTETHLGWYFYRVQFSDSHGNLSEFSDELHGQWPTPATNTVPHVLKLYPCQPNPFNPRTTIRYDVPEAGPVRLSVFNVAGRLIRTLVDDRLPQGSHAVVWDGRDATGREVASGSYLARLECGGVVVSMQMGLVR